MMAQSGESMPCVMGCYLLNLSPKAGKGREQRPLSSVLQDRQAPETKHKSEVVQLTQTATLRVEGICQLGLPLGLVCSPKHFHEPASAKMGGWG